MSTTPIDFSSIGGTPVSQSKIDFSSIGGSPVAASPSTAPTAETGILEGIKRNTIGAAQNLYHTFADPANDQEREHFADLGKRMGLAPEVYGDPSKMSLVVYRMLEHPSDTLSQKASAELRSNSNGVKFSGVTDKILAHVPLLGPAVNSIAERAESGDVSGAAVDTAALMAPDIAEGIRQFQPIRTLAPSGIPERLYKSALKQSTTLTPAESAREISTGLNNEIPVSPSGVEKLGMLVDDLNSKTKDIIDKASNQGATVNKFAVTSKLSDLISKRGIGVQVNPNSDLAAVASSGNEFLENQPNEIPAANAQALKSGTYTSLAGKYGELGSAATEAQKALARGIKEELINQFPELKDIGKSESDLLDLAPTLSRAVNRISNHQLIGIGTPIAAGATKAVTGSTGLGAVAGFLKAVIDDPMVKSKIAIALSRKGVTPASSFSRLAAYSTSLANAANDAKTSDQEGQQ